jgi:protein-tyrosine phosphatase
VTEQGDQLPPQTKPTLAYPQRARLQRFSIEHSVDTHCHVLPGIDDGPASLEESLGLCRALVRDGITVAIATPHQLGRFEGTNHVAHVRALVDELQAALDQRRIPLRVVAGGEVRVDERIPRLLSDGMINALGPAGHYLLLELPTGFPVDPAPVLDRFEPDLPSDRIILAHAERCDGLNQQPELAEAWIQQGVALQVNAGGLLGAFGRGAQVAALDWLGRGWVSIIATDAHSTGSRRPRMSEAIDFIAREFGEAVARRVCLENPLRVLNGQPLQSADQSAASEQKSA